MPALDVHDTPAEVELLTGNSDFGISCEDLRQLNEVTPVQ